jgi:hypothetical protein
MTAPRQKELETMSVFELLNKLIFDQSNGSHYRTRLMKLLAIAGTNDIKKLVDDELIDPEPEPRSNDYVAMNIRRKNEGEQIKFINYMISSGWDYIDPRGKMYTPPDDVKGFLQDKLDNHVDSFKEMSHGEQGLMNAISDSFIHWIRMKG